MLNGSTSQTTNPQIANNPAQFISQFNNFAKTMTPQKAQQIIMEKLISGAISQSQFATLQQQAQQFMNFLGK